ncbi:hypothetical protein BDZ89DRAFT_1054127, partial [Hymenopellis radicata]
MSTASTLVKRTVKTTKKVATTNAVGKTNKRTISTATESVVTEDASELSALPSELTISTLEMQTMDKSWYNALVKEFDKDYFIKVGEDNSLKQFLVQEHKEHVVYPP